MEDIQSHALTMQLKDTSPIGFLHRLVYKTNKMQEDAPLIDLIKRHCPQKTFQARFNVENAL